MEPIECDFCAACPSEVTVTRKDGKGAVRARLRLCRRCVDLQQYIALVQNKVLSEKAPCFICGDPASAQSTTRGPDGKLLGRVALCHSCAQTRSGQLASMLRTSNLWTPGVLELPGPVQRAR